MITDDKKFSYKKQYNYLEVAAKYISDSALAEQIQLNLDFIEKYFDEVDLRFNELKERQIVYKQLGIMAFSCAEALWKSLVFAINKHCEERDCKEAKCPYRKFESDMKLNSAKPKEILEHLSDTRLINILPFEMEAIEEMQELRNHIHLTRTLIDGDKSDKFNKQFVDKMLRLYYVTLNLLEINQWYFQEYKPCIKELDSSAYEDSKQGRIKDYQRYISDNVSYSTSDIFYNKPISEENQRILKKLINDKNFDINAMSDYIGRWLYYESSRFLSEEEYNNAVNNYFNKLKEYISPDSKLIEKIVERKLYYFNLFKAEE